MHQQKRRSSARGMIRPWPALGVYLSFVFIGGPLLAPWLYHVVVGLSATMPALAEPRFHRFVHRSLLGLALLGAWPLLRSVGLASLSAIGLNSVAGQGRLLVTGFALGFASLSFAAALNVGLGARVWRTDLAWSSLVAELSEALAAASLVALLEEFLFRGVLFRVLALALPSLAALGASALLYALVHFFERPTWAGEVVWSSGLSLLPAMLGGFVDLDRLLPSFLSLALAGLLLGELYRRTGTLWASIGLHAGWIFWLRAYRELTQEVVPSACTWCGSAKLIDGWTTLLALAVLCLAVFVGPSLRQCNK